MVRNLGEITVLPNRKIVATLQRDDSGPLAVLQGHIKGHDRWIPEKTNIFFFNHETWAEFKELVTKIDKAMIRRDRRKVRFGTVAVQKGYVTLKQVIDALALQAKENLSTGKHKHIGQILLEQGLIHQQQLDDILRTMEKVKED
jgi:hypothetical protein